MNQSKLSVLIVDDDQDLLTLLSQSFRRNGMVADVCLSAEDAVSKLSSNTYSALLSDIKLGGISGLDLAYRVRKHPRLTLMPVFLMTGDFDNPLLNSASELGIVEVIAKPFDTSQVAERVKHAAMAASPTALTPSQNVLSADIFRSALEIFHIYLKGNLQFENYTNSFRVDITGDLSATVHFAGPDATGFLCISLNNQITQKICSKIMQIGEEAKLDVELVCDLMEGIVKQIVGHANNWLAAHGVNIIAGPASVISGDNHTLSRRSKNAIQTAALVCDGTNCGYCHLSISPNL